MSIEHEGLPTVTGRSSSREPNLVPFPRIESTPGVEAPANDDDAVYVRDIDYASIETRLLAHLGGAGLPTEFFGIDMGAADGGKTVTVIFDGARVMAMIDGKDATERLNAHLRKAIEGKHNRDMIGDLISGDLVQRMAYKLAHRMHHETLAPVPRDPKQPAWAARNQPPKSARKKRR